MCKAVARLSLQDSLRLAHLLIESHEGFAVGVVSVHLAVDRVEGVVVAPFSVLCLMVDGRAFHFHLPRGKVSLEVLHVRGCVPQTPFHEREQFQVLDLISLVGNCHLLHFRPLVERDEEKDTCTDTVLLACDAGIVHAVSALVKVKRSLAGFPPRIPYRLPVLDVKIPATVVHGHVIVAITRDPPELSVLVETVTTRSVGDQREEVLIAEIVDPRPRRLWIGDDILAVSIIKMTVVLVFHFFELNLYLMTSTNLVFFSVSGMTFPN